MRKLTILTLLIFVATLIFASCSALGDVNVTDSSSDMSGENKRIEKVLDALISQDVVDIKSMFSQSALSETDDFDEDLDYLFGFFQGKVLSLERKGTSTFEDRDLNGITKKSYEWYRVDTDIQSYLFILIEILEDTENSRNVGLYTLRVIRLEDEETLFPSWDDVEEPGIFKP